MLGEKNYTSHPNTLSYTQTHTSERLRSIVADANMDALYYIRLRLLASDEVVHKQEEAQWFDCFQICRTRCLDYE